MNKFLFSCLACTLIIASCTKDDNTSETKNTPQSLLLATHYQSTPNYTFEYDDENRLSKTITNGGVETKEFFYNEDGQLTGFIETTQSNALYPTRRFEVEVNTSTEISGSFKLYDPNDVLDPLQTVQYIYKLDNGLLKSFTANYPNGPWERSFEHDIKGNMTGYQLFENPDNGHLARMEFTSWDNKNNSNIYTNILNGMLPFDIIPGIKLTKNNILDAKQVYQGINCCSPAEYYYEYNSYNQVTRIYGLSADVINEEGQIEIPGGEEVDIATFEYVEVE